MPELAHVPFRVRDGRVEYGRFEMMCMSNRPSKEEMDKVVLDSDLVKGELTVRNGEPVSVF